MFPKTLQKQTGIRAPFVLNRDCMGAGIAARCTATLAVLFVNRRMWNRTDGGVRGVRGCPLTKLNGRQLSQAATLSAG